MTPGVDYYVYHPADGRMNVLVRMEQDTAWLTVHQMADLYRVEEAVNSYDENSWLGDWEQAPKEAVLHSDDPKVWRILACYWLQEPVDFIYHGGSEAGTPRRVIPKEVFEVEGYSSVWFRGYCDLRQAERTFNMKRMEFIPMFDEFVID